MYFSANTTMKFLIPKGWQAIRPRSRQRTQGKWNETEGGHSADEPLVAINFGVDRGQDAETC